MHPTSLPRHRLAILALVALLLGWVTAPPAQAQLTEIHVFACKLVCGYQLGNVRLLNDPRPLNQPYENLKPGNYATTCNIYNYDIDLASQPVFVYIALKGAPLIFLTQLTVPALAASSFGCLDVVNSVPPPPPNGAAFEGYLAFFTLVPTFEVDGVHTYSSQNAFERHVLWAYDSFGLVKIAFETLGLNVAKITSPLASALTELSSQYLAASGAGGLGLGASIDIQHYEINTIDLTADNEPRVPIEVRDAMAAGLKASP